MNHEHHLEKRALPVCSPNHLRYDRRQLHCPGNQERDDEMCADRRLSGWVEGWDVRILLCHCSMFNGVEHWYNRILHPDSSPFIPPESHGKKNHLLLWWVMLFVIMDPFVDLTLDHWFLFIQILYKVIMFPLGTKPFHILDSLKIMPVLCRHIQ